MLLEARLAAQGISVLMYDDATLMRPDGRFQPMSSLRRPSCIGSWLLASPRLGLLDPRRIGLGDGARPSATMFDQ